MKTFCSLSVLAFVIFLTSCNNLHIEKRHYRNGFYVNLGSDDRKDRSATVDNQQESSEISPASVEKAVTEITPQQEVPGADNSQQAPVVKEVVPVTTVQDNPVALKQEESPRAEIKQGDSRSKQTNSSPSASDAMLIIEVLLAIFIPPLAVFLHEGITTWFWLTLILCILGGGFFFYPVIGGLWLVAVIIALLVVFDAI